MNILTENEINIKSLEKEIYDYACKLAAKAFSNFLDVLDQELMKSRDKGILRHKGHRKKYIFSYRTKHKSSGCMECSSKTRFSN